MKVLRKIIIFVIFLFIVPQAFSDEEIILLNYKKIDESVLNKFEFSTKNKKIANIINDKTSKKLYLNIVNPLNPKDIEIQVNYKWKIYNTIYKYKPKFKQNLDISNNIKIKRLQKMPLSCELSVAADILTHLTSKNVQEEDILLRIDKTYLNKTSEKYDNKIFWWNPNAWFVWYIDYYWDKKQNKPAQRNMTWYWVYEKPIAQIYAQYWFEYEIISKQNYKSELDEKKHLTILLKNLEKWNMVQLWWDWCTKNDFDDWTINKLDINQEKVDKNIYAKNYCATTDIDRKIEWYYYEDWQLKKNIWLIWEHSFYLLWYEWWVENPTKIIVWDTDTGYHKYDTKEWMRKWNLMDNKSIIVKKLDNF